MSRRARILPAVMLVGTALGASSPVSAQPIPGASSPVSTQPAPGASRPVSAPPGPGAQELDDLLEAARDRAAHSWLGKAWSYASEWAEWRLRDRTDRRMLAGIGDLLALFSPRSARWRLDLPIYRFLRVAPVSAPQSSPYGMRFHPVLKRPKMHKGLDFRADLGTKVKAAAPGRVVFAGSRGSYGRLVIIDHGLGFETRYAHLHRISVRRGEFVAAGAIIGRVGASGRVTGAHLHFEVRHGDQAVNPKNCFLHPLKSAISN